MDVFNTRNILFIFYFFSLNIFNGFGRYGGVLYQVHEKTLNKKGLVS
jgi:hypothetical protein